ncbi:hypothetical protein F5B19DRAFT_4859 [Rostrohypoxylon terebratum]|nr:hypothetical protein F5B19DRAFT_4859 [Rostrohypoxylon terebratum]
MVCVVILWYGVVPSTWCNSNVRLACVLGIEVVGRRNACWELGIKKRHRANDSLRLRTGRKERKKKDREIRNTPLSCFPIWLGERKCYRVLCRNGRCRGTLLCT